MLQPLSNCLLSGVDPAECLTIYWDDSDEDDDDSFGRDGPQWRIVADEYGRCCSATLLAGRQRGERGGAIQMVDGLFGRCVKSDRKLTATVTEHLPMLIV